MFRLLLITALILIPMTDTQAQSTDRDRYVDEARRLMRESPLIDGHNDFPWAARETHGLSLDSLDLAEPQPEKMTDLDRMREGLVGGQFWVAYTPSAFHHNGAPRVAFEQIDFIHQMVDRYDDLEWGLTADAIMEVFERGNIASLIGLEGGHMIENSLALLRQFYTRGVRYMTLTHGQNVDWADSGTDDQEHGGLTAFGEEVVREMNWLGMLVDLSHVSDSTVWDALRVTEAPVIFSHSSSRHFTPHKRNVPDDIARAVTDNGGVIMVNFVTVFTYMPAYEWYQEFDSREGEERARWREDNPMPLPDIDDIVDHIEHLRDLAGVDHIGIGSDFDGIGSTPVGLENVSTFPYLVAELLSRGWSEEEVKKVMGLNLLRVMREAEATAHRLRSERGPGMARIEAVDEWGVEPEWTEPRGQR